MTKMELIDISALMGIIGLLTLGTNVITEVLKKSFPKIPAQLTALFVAMALTLGALAAFLQINNIAFEWYYWAGGVVMGFFVSYAAQFGFDKLKELIAKFKE